MRATGSPIDPVASTSQARLDDSESATSPGAESDLYLSFPDTPAETTGAMSEELDEAALVRTHEIHLCLWIHEGPFMWTRLIFVIL